MMRRKRHQISSSSSSKVEEQPLVITLIDQKRKRKNQQQVMKMRGGWILIVITLLLLVLTLLLMIMWHHTASQSPRCAEDHDDCACPDPYVAQPRWMSHGTTTTTISAQEPAATDGTTTAAPATTTPSPKATNIDPDWQKHHNATYRLSGLIFDNNHAKHQVIFVGDSVLEHWDGTRSAGTRPMEKADLYRQSFQIHFNQESYNWEDRYENAAPFQSRIWATSGDTAPEVLWHLDALEAQYEHSPQGQLQAWNKEHAALAAAAGNDKSSSSSSQTQLVWVLLIGTNDLARYGCHRETVLEGIQKVALRLQDFGRRVLEAPSTRILVHGLLPRADPGTTALGTAWHRDIVWINEQLEQFVAARQLKEAQIAFWLDDNNQAATSTKWRYMDAASVFLDETSSKLRHMSDGLHPDLAGYRDWADPLLENLVKLMADET